MGFAKYNEDDREIIEGRLWNKQVINYYQETERKLRRKQIAHKQGKSDNHLLKESFEQLKQHISNLKVWVEFYQATLEEVETVDLRKYIKYRCEDLDLTLDRYYNEYFSVTYKELREKEKSSLTVENEWFVVIQKDFLQTFINYLKGLANTNQKESMVIRVLYEDLDIYMKKYFLNYQILIGEKGMIKTIIEDILEEQEEVYECPYCHKETYESFKICLNCNRGRDSM